MKPVLILQNLTSDGPSYLGRWLASQGVPADVRNAEAGDAYPETLAAHGAVAMLGGEMSANDDLPWLRRAEALFLQALRQGVPTLGHCLGGQLMARALGARVASSPAPEVGFQEMQVHSLPEARAWFGQTKRVHVFHWHYEAFDLPCDAVALATSDACPCQAFAIGPHLAMQFHIELDREKLERWSQEESEQWARARSGFPATVHDRARMQVDAAALLPGQQALADRIYTRWLLAARAR